MVDGVGHRRRTPVSEQTSGLEGLACWRGIQKPPFLEPFSPAGQRKQGSGIRAAAASTGTWQEEVDSDVYLSRFLWGIRTELTCPAYTRPWDYGSGQRREKSLPRLVLRVQGAKKAVSGQVAHHQYGGW